MSEENTGAVSESVTEEPIPALEEEAAPVTETPEGEDKTEDAPAEKAEDEPKADAEEESEGSDGDEPAVEDEPEEKPKRNRPGKAQRQLIKAQAEIDALKGMVYALAEKQGGPGPADPGQQRSDTTPADFPKQEDFTDYSQFLDAKAEWVAERKAQEVIERERNSFQEKQAKRSHDAAMAAHMGRVDKARVEYEDFDEVAFADDVMITPEMHNAILGSEHGPKVQYYLGSHPDEAARITRMDAYAQVREIGKLEAKLTAKPPKKSTTAPPPPKTLKGGGKPEKDPAKMTQAEYEAWRNKKAS
ncbi:hypothetical protein HBA54_04200 [Pelagibius litoralis]|uniref:Scaffolding protein n=1 Tax=Pelagibius litoralis TaxID=374515 RepID=A0A967CAY9_9PROT|nr:hypothetical protein [Pelagibius litoralis]NIA67784.1 hypothetical protein [Pelagibius litoralis]